MLQRTWQDERGFSLVLIGVGLVAFLAATTIAIDVGMFMTARAQAQNSADAGALAGATALAFDDYNNRSAAGPAVQNALRAAEANQVMGNPVSVTPADVTFLNDPSGNPNMVQVQVFRTGARGNGVRTLMGVFFGVPRVDIQAVAVGQATPANTVVRNAPFMLPDKWVERQTAPWDVTDTFDMYDNRNQLLASPDIYIPADQPGYTGYSAIRDRGLELMIRAGTGNNIEPTMYFSWKEGTDNAQVGGDWYRDNIVTGNPNPTHWNQILVQEPGDKSGPTTQGVDALIAQDPDAFWDPTSNSVHSELNPSPRIVSIPLYDPAYYATGKANGRPADFRLAGWLGFFIVGRSGNNIFGRVTPIVGTIDPNAGPAPAGAFPMAIRLVQ